MRNIIVIAALMISTTAFAQENVDTDIKGNTNINATVGTATTSANGKDATATSNTGSISESKIEGNTNITANVDTTTTRANGQGATAAFAAGSIRGAKIKGNTNLTAKVGTATTTATDKGACAETRVAVIGKRSCKK